MTRFLLLLDNHESHISTEVLDFAKEHGVVMLSFSHGRNIVFGQAYTAELLGRHCLSENI